VQVEASGGSGDNVGHPSFLLSQPFKMAGLSVYYSFCFNLETDLQRNTLIFDLTYPTSLKSTEHQQSITFPTSISGISFERSPQRMGP
jgi:hypothetical protein